MPNPFYFRGEVQGERLTATLKYRQKATVTCRAGFINDFAIDSLRYDRAFIADPEQAALVRRMHEEPGEHKVPPGGIQVVKFWENARPNQHTWCLPHWHSNQWPLEVVTPADRLPRSLRYRHLAVAIPITEVDVYSRPQWTASFPWELMQKEEACPLLEPISHRLETLLVGHSVLPPPILLHKFSADKVGQWRYAEWDQTAWDLRALDPIDLSKYTS